MSGIESMAIARWVGHQDRGVFVGEVQGDMSSERAKRQAQKVDFGSKSSDMLPRMGRAPQARTAENPPKNRQLFPLDRVLPVCKPAAMMNVSEKQFSFACPASMNGRHHKEQFPVNPPPARRQ